MGYVLFVAIPLRPLRGRLDMAGILVEDGTMRRRIWTALLVAVLLLSAATTRTLSAAPVDSRSTQEGPVTGHVPADVRMDRDFADIPRPQIASPIATVLPRVAMATPATERFIVPFLALDQPSAIIEQQHVFRI